MVTIYNYPGRVSRLNTQKGYEVIGKVANENALGSLYVGRKLLIAVDSVDSRLHNN